jgi:hypothetical protein
MISRVGTTLYLSILAMAAACGDDEAGSTPFELKFAAQAAGKAVTCDAMVSGLGPAGAHAIGVSDLRFYVSNLVLFGDDGAPLQVDLDDNEFQYNSAAGSVSLIDLTSNAAGTCSNAAIAFAEGTSRINERIVGKTSGEVHAVSFDVGVQAAVMKETIATTSPQGPGNQTGEGYLHIGSRDCGAEGKRALEDRDECGRAYIPKVALPHFHTESSTVVLDVAQLVSGLDFTSPIYDPVTFEPIGEGPGVECHSVPEGQPDCPVIFGKLGLDQASGAADALSNRVFSAR